MGEAKISVLTEIACAMFGPKSELVALIAGLVVFAFFISLALNSSDADVSYVIKSIFFISALISVGGIVKHLFNIDIGC